MTVVAGLAGNLHGDGPPANTGAEGCAASKKGARPAELSDTHRAALGGAALTTIRQDTELIASFRLFAGTRPSEDHWAEMAIEAARRRAVLRQAYCALRGLTPSFFAFGRGRDW